jgi:hypothetical protein
MSIKGVAGDDGSALDSKTGLRTALCLDLCLVILCLLLIVVFVFVCLSTDPSQWSKADVTTWLQSLQAGDDGLVFDASKLQVCPGKFFIKRTQDQFEKMAGGPVGVDIFNELQSLLTPGISISLTCLTSSITLQSTAQLKSAPLHSLTPNNYTITALRYTPLCYIPLHYSSTSTSTPISYSVSNLTPQKR